MKNNDVISSFTLEELNDFFFFKRYTVQTQNIIKAIFLDGMKQKEISTLLGVTPQRVNNIKNQFLIDFADTDEFVRIEMILPVREIGDLKVLRQKCKFYQVKFKNSPPPR